MYFKSLLAVASLIFISACGGGSNSTNTAKTLPEKPFVEQTYTKCSPGDELFFGKYLVRNNLWGLRYYPTYTDYSACVSATTTLTLPKYEFTWDWRNPPGDGVKAYQEIRYDKTIPVTEIGNLSFNHDVTVEATGRYNIAYDFFLDSYSNFSAPQSLEVMIWVAKSDQWVIRPPAGAELVMFNGVEYTAWNDTVRYPDGTLTQNKMAMFLASNPMLKGTIQLKPFIDYLIQKGSLPSHYLLNRSEFGSEQESGKGKLIINHYSINN
jgi:hypothetical protein